MSLLHEHRDPGPCPVCDTPHTACTAPLDGGVVTIVQLPARDGLTEPPLVGALPTPPLLVAEQVQATLPPGSTTTGTYRRKGRA